MATTEPEILLEVHVGRDALREHRQTIRLKSLSERLAALDAASAKYAPAA